jgi:GNAT superfamily N-acetyltransferase
MVESDLVEADRVFRGAFGAFLGVDPPESFGGDGDCIVTRWRANPARAFVAVRGHEVIGSAFVTIWGSVGFFGPLTVRPDYWDQGVGKRLLEPVMTVFDQCQVKHAGLYTFPNSPKHLGLYQGLGFWPRFLTLTMTRPIGLTKTLKRVNRFSELSSIERPSCLSACRELTDSVYQRLDVCEEIQSVANQALGDTVLVWEPGGSRLAGLAVCHIGPGTEAGSGTCYIKFAAVRPGSAAGERFPELLEACESLGALRGMSNLTGGMNSGRSEAYRVMLANGFRAVYCGVTMHRPNEPGYCRPDVFLVDDWR